MKVHDLKIYRGREFLGLFCTYRLGKLQFSSWFVVPKPPTFSEVHRCFVPKWRITAHTHPAVGDTPKHTLYHTRKYASMHTFWAYVIIYGWHCCAHFLPKHNLSYTFSTLNVLRPPLSRYLCRRMSSHHLFMGGKCQGNAGDQGAAWKIQTGI